MEDNKNMMLSELSYRLEAHPNAAKSDINSLYYFSDGGISRIEAHTFE